MAKPVNRMRNALIWIAFLVVVAVPLTASTVSPLLAWREPVYIIAGLAGVLALTLLLVQPVLVAGYLPGIQRASGRQFHRWIGGALVFLVVVHVGALWITSPPDVIDALTFSSPTLFSAWGVIAMWAVFAAACVVALRNKLRLGPRTWRRLHTGLAVVVVVCSVVHALLIEGTMETVSKIALCVLVVGVTVRAFSDLKVWKQWWSQ